MPVYNVTLHTPGGPERRRFTLDQAGPINLQLRQVLAEICGDGPVLAGGPDDELVLVCGGREVPAHLSPGELGLSPLQDLELRLRPRGAGPATSARREPLPVAFFTRGGYVSALWGATGALHAWALLATQSELGLFVSSYARLDQLACTLFGAAVGASVLGGEALRRVRSVPRSALLGIALGYLGGVASALAGTAGAEAVESVTGSYRAARMVAWAILGALAGGAIGSGAGQDRLRHSQDAGWSGLAAGAVVGLLPASSAAAELWQLASFAVIAAAIGWGYAAPSLARADAVLEQVPERASGATILGLREWPLARHGAILLPGADGARVEFRAGQVRLLPGRGRGVCRVGDEVVGDGGVELCDGDLLLAGGAQYRFHCQPTRR